VSFVDRQPEATSSRTPPSKVWPPRVVVCHEDLLVSRVLHQCKIRNRPPVAGLLNSNFWNSLGLRRWFLCRTFETS